VNPAYVVARLNPSTPSLSGSGGGSPELTSAETAAALSGIRTFERTVVLTKYAQWRKEKHLAELLLRRALDMALANKWRYRDGQMLALCEMAVFEFLNPPPCRVCDMTGQVAKTREERVEGDDPLKTCPSCNGAGSRRYSGSRKAEAIGVNQSNWSRIWCRRYDKVFYELESAEYRALRQVKINLEGHHENA
jgi:hypothetical protein